MAVRFYDEALVQKFQKWIKNPNLKVLKPDEVTRLYQIRADENNDQPLQLPLIALSRAPAISILSPNKKPLSFDGMMEEANDNKSIQLNAIPISISYQLDIFTRHYIEGDEYVRNFMFNLINHPKFHITIPYNGKDIPHDFNIKLNSEIVDNSDMPQRLFPGQITRWTISFVVDDAYLFSIPVKENVDLSDEQSKIEAFGSATTEQEAD